MEVSNLHPCIRRKQLIQVHPESSGARRGYHEEGNEEEDKDQGALPRIRQLGEAEGRASGR